MDDLQKFLNKQLENKEFREEWEKMNEDTLFIYIMYSSKMNTHKIGESRDPKRRLREVSRGGTGGDSSVVLVAVFPVDESLLVHRSSNNVDSVFHGFCKDQTEYSEWFRMSEEECMEAIKNGFKKLKEDSDRFRKKQFKERWSRRYNHMLSETIHLKSFKEFERAMIFLHRLYDKLNGDIDVYLTGQDFYRLSTYFFKSYMRNKVFWDLLIGEEEFFRGLLFFLKKRKNRERVRQDEEMMKRIDSIIHGQKESIYKWRARVRFSLPVLEFNRATEREIESWTSAMRDYNYLVEMDWYLAKRYYCDIDQTFSSWGYRL